MVECLRRDSRRIYDVFEEIRTTPSTAFLVHASSFDRVLTSLGTRGAPALLPVSGLEFQAICNEASEEACGTCREFVIPRCAFNETSSVKRKFYACFVGAKSKAMGRERNPGRVLALSQTNRLTGLRLPKDRSLLALYNNEDPMLRMQQKFQ